MENGKRELYGYVLMTQVFRDVLILLKFGKFSPECKETGSSGTTKSEVSIDNINVKA